MQELQKKHSHVFAPPFVIDGDVAVSQTAACADYVASKHGWTKEKERSKLLCTAMTIMDFGSEIHDLHHPVSTALYYEDQKEEAKKVTDAFFKDRIGKWMEYFKRFAVLSF